MTRRFELIEGKSAKFWEVTIDGADLHLRWGRIGTQGQSQTKSFPSDAAAQKEADKLVAQKTKKGYAEVEATDAPVKEAETAPREAAEAEPVAAEPVAAEPVAAEPSAAPEPTAPSEPAAAPSPSDAAVAPLLPRVRPHDIFASKWGRREPTWEIVRVNTTHTCKQYLEHERLFPPGEDADRTRRVFEILAAEQPPEELDIDTAAQLLAVAQYAVREWLAARLGPADLVRAVIASGAYQYVMRSAGNAYYSVLARSYTSPPYYGGRAVELYCAAGTVADRLDDADLSAIVAEVEAEWDAWPIEQRARAAIVLGARAPSLVARTLEAPSYPGEVLSLIASISDVADAQRLMERLDKTSASAQLAACVLLVVRRGVDAAPILLAVAQRLNEVHTIVEVIKHIEAVPVAQLMGDLLDHRQYKARAREYLESAPAFAIAGLATTRKAAARSFVEALVRAQPALVDEVWPHLGEAERAAIEQIRIASSVNVPDASPEELPRVLAAPPWAAPAKKKKSTGKPVVLELTPLEMPESVEWRSGQRAAWRSLEGVSPTPNGSQRLRQELEDALAGKSRGISTYSFSYAEDEVALECWNRMTPDTFGYTYGNTVRCLVARFEERGIPGYLAYAAKNASTATEVFSRVRSPRMAPLYAKALASSGKGRTAGQVWLESFPEEAAAGLIPKALGKDKKARALAEGAIAYLGLKGHGEVVLSVARKYGEACVAPVKEMLERDPLDDFPSKLPKLPDWASAAALPRPLLAGRQKALPVSAVEHLLTMLAFSPLDPPYPGIAQVRDACDPRSLVELAWALFSNWLGADGSSSGDWAMLALAHLGGDEAARRLTPLIRRWPGESAHARAVKGLDVLAAIGSDVALMHLHGIAQKLKFKGLQAKAQEKIAQIAEARELTPEELADRLVPDLDLDENGTMVLDFGPRRFTVGFDEHLAPFVLENGSRRKDLPKPAKSDDAEKAKEATERYKALKKDARAIASHQIARLEQLMCSERRVPLDAFRNFFVEHPLVFHLVRRLVWGEHAADGSVRAFRVDDERRPTSAEDEPIELAEGAEISLLHPLAMDEATKARFGELFADYEILQPFEQLGRATYAATEEELAKRALVRFEKKTAALGAIRGLESKGWVRGLPQDAGIVWDVAKPIPGHPDLEVVVSLDPGFSAAGIDFDDTGTQTIGAPVLRKKGTWSGANEPLERLGAVQMSELIRDLTLIT